MLRALHYSHTLLNQLILKFPKGNFIDATLGKGNDAHFILTHPNFEGHLYGFDIQPQAIEFSKTKLSSIPPSNYTLFEKSHSEIQTLLPNIPLHGAIFNLGYLPGGDHAITTHVSSTISAIEQIAHQLVTSGQIILVVYSGHPEGQKEKEALFSTLSRWPQEQYQVLQYEFINQKNHPPMLLIIEKI